MVTDVDDSVQRAARWNAKFRRTAQRRFALALGWSAATLVACTTSFNLEERRRPDAGADIGGDALSLDVPTDASMDMSIDVPEVQEPDVAVDTPPPDNAGPDVVDAPVDVPCGVCPAGRECCADTCVNTTSDRSHCGDCTTVCPGTTCSGGSCTSNCALGFLDCDRNAVNGCEVNAATDAMNCGACGIACPGARPCVAGRCACPIGRADCDGNPANACEADIAGDPMRCGDCTTRCMANQSCTMGVCGCSTGFADCDADATNGCETDVRTTAAHCGRCGTACGMNAACTAGACACDMGFQRCPATAPNCAVRTNDPMNCGACGVVCGVTMPVCAATGCATGCMATESLCGASCVNTATDVSRCGDCATACPSRPQSSIRCAAGVCGIVCDAGFGNCDGVAANGCEANLGTSATHCGACGVACTMGHLCVAGACACPAGQVECGGRCVECCADADCSDGNPCTEDRCVLNACQRSACSTRVLICCGSACRGCCVDGDCPAGSGRGCGSDGTCSVCLSGRADCDGIAANGCETDTTTSLLHCGACGAACAFPNAAASCSAGRCMMGACNTGYADCDGLTANGCEVNLLTDVAHCGTCATSCSFPGSGAACRMGVCLPTTCMPGRGDCDGNTANGCETDLNTSVANCGACSAACLLANATPSCVAGACVIASCNAGFGNCDGNTANGCEADLRTSVANCGSCATACSLPFATAACAAGICTVASCAAGRGNCDAMAANGCETDTRTSLANCGMCGAACPAVANASSACTGATCGFTCNTSFGNCDGIAANGCEADLRTSLANCGACASPCAVANGVPSCAASTCTVASCTSGWNNCNASAVDGCELNCGAVRACSAARCAPGWLTMTTSPLSARHHMYYAIAPNRHELLVWGGVTTGTTVVDDGARYNWDTNTWTAMAPSPLSARAYGRGVWTGTEFFVWGGDDGGRFDDGALYNPATNTWRDVATDGRPSARAGFHAYWIGAEVLVYGGEDGGTIRQSGGLFNPATDTWRAVPTRPTAALHDASIWTGSQLVVWGGSGSGCAGAIGTGSAFVPGGAWSSISMSGAPSGRWFTTIPNCPAEAWQTVAMGATQEMFVWGGHTGPTTYSNTGARYQRIANAWRSIAAPPAGIVGGAELPMVVWTGTVVLGWSPSVMVAAVSVPQNVVFTYDPAADVWSASTPVGAPQVIADGAASGWSGTEFIVWGGRTALGVSSGQGGRLAPP